MSDIKVQETGTAADESRRTFLKKAAIVAWSAPVIMTVTSNKARAAHGCIHFGQTCTQGQTTGPLGCCTPVATLVTGGGKDGAAVVCCGTGSSPANVNKCKTPTGANTITNGCNANADCCSNKCTGGVCAA